VYVQVGIKPDKFHSVTEFAVLIWVPLFLSIPYSVISFSGIIAVFN
jgi:hypothetical protein